MRNLIKKLSIMVLFCTLFGVQNLNSMNDAVPVRRNLQDFLIDQVFNRDIGEIKLLVKLGADVNELGKGEEYWSEVLPLEYAIYMGFPEIFELLLELGADPYKKGFSDRNMFKETEEAIWAAENSNNSSERNKLSGRRAIMKILEYEKISKFKLKEALENCGLCRDVIDIICGY